MEEEAQEFTEASKIPRGGELVSLPAGSQLGRSLPPCRGPRGLWGPLTSREPRASAEGACFQLAEEVRSSCGQEEISD